MTQRFFCGLVLLTNNSFIDNEDDIPKEEDSSNPDFIQLSPSSGLAVAQYYSLSEMREVWSVYI